MNVLFTLGVVETPVERLVIKLQSQVICYRAALRKLETKALNESLIEAIDHYESILSRLVLFVNTDIRAFVISRYENQVLSEKEISLADNIVSDMEDQFITQQFCSVLIEMFDEVIATTDNPRLRLLCKSISRDIEQSLELSFCETAA